ncbi:MAG: lipoate protein ligase C-terminal domain-containing protein [Sedimentibacter sp.]
MLQDLLKTTEGKIESKSVKSVRSIVTNIKDNLKSSAIDIDDFQKLLVNTMFDNKVEKYEITQKEIEAVKELVENKYSKWEWNFGGSPDFCFEKESEILGNTIYIKLYVKKGVITECNIVGNNIFRDKLEENIIGSRYSYFNILNKLEEFSFLKNVKNINYEELADCFF